MLHKVFVAVMTVVAVAAGLAAQQAPAFHAGTRTVPIYATVVDKNGRLVRDLTKDDFEVFDNGKRQEVTLFKNDIQPITAVIMVDRSGSLVWPLDRIQTVVEGFIAELLPSDRARLGSFSSEIEIEPPDFTSDHQELLKILHRDPQPAGPAPLWDATAAAMTALAGQPGRRVVVIFSASKDSPDPAGVHGSLATVMERAPAEEIVVYAVGLAGKIKVEPAPTPNRPGAMPILFQGRGGGRGGQGGRGGRGQATTLDPGAASTPDPGLKKLAVDSGGRYDALDPADGFDSTFDRIADELHHQYALAFVASALDGKVHTLTLKVRRPDLTVRARKSYLAAPETPPGK